MKTRTIVRKSHIKHKIIHIDEKKCNGCGACAACHEGAIGIVEGKAKLLQDAADGTG